MVGSYMSAKLGKRPAKGKTGKGKTSKKPTARKLYGK